MIIQRKRFLLFFIIFSIVTLLFNSSIFAQSASKLQILLPGMTAAPGTETGFSGQPDDQTTGVPFEIVINAVDDNWNIVPNYDQISISASDPYATLPLPENIYLEPGKAIEKLEERGTIATGLFDRPGAHPVTCRSPLPSTLPSSRPDRVVEFTRLLSENRDGSVIICARTQAAADRLQTIITDARLDIRRAASFPDAEAGHGITMITGILSGGFSFPGDGLTIISDADLFGPPSGPKTSRTALPEWDLPIGSLLPGDFAVHIDHGIARYEGLKQLVVARSTDDFMHLTFADGDSLYVPVWQMNRIQRYRSGYLV